MKPINIGKATYDTDAVNKEFLLHELESYIKNIQDNCDRKFRYVKTRNGLDFKNEKLHNVGRPARESDAVNVRYLFGTLNMADDKITNMMYIMYADLAKDKPIKSIEEFESKYNTINN